MKKLLLLLFALFLVQGISAQVWLPIGTDLLNLESFRHQATQSIEDDLDNSIDGTDIFAVNGARIYTNLSNLVSGGERQADNMSSNQTVLIGATSPIFYRGLKVTAFYGNTNENESWEDIMDSTYLEDTDADETWDQRTDLYRKENGKGESSMNSILLNIGKILGEDREVALTYKRSGMSVLEEMGDTLSFLYQDLTPTVVIQTIYNQSANASGSIQVPITTYALSYSMPFKDWKFRGDLFYMTGGEKMEGSADSYYWQNLDPDDDATTFEDLVTTDEAGETSFSANAMGINARLSDLNKYGVLWEVGGNFAMISGSGDNNSTETYNYLGQREWFANQIEVLDTTYIETVTGPISVSGNSMGLNGRIEWQISENVRFGIGGMYNTFSVTLEEDRASRVAVNSAYNNDDGVTIDPADYVIVANGGSDRTLTEEISVNRIAMPAGVEVNFGKNKDWFMRLGAIAIGSKEENTSSSVVDSVLLYVREVTDGTGFVVRTFDTSLTDPDEEYTSSSTYTDVIYSYGLGWKPSPNLSLDLIGMFDVSGVELLSTDWLRSLKLSATINIY